MTPLTPDRPAVGGRGGRIPGVGVADLPLGAVRDLAAEPALAAEPPGRSARDAVPPRAAASVTPETRRPAVGAAPCDARFGALMVPVAYGGQLCGVDTLARTVRPAFRRDVSAGMSRVGLPFSAALHVWVAGSYEQRLRLADHLMDGGGVASRSNALSVRETFAPRGLRVRRIGGDLVLDGEYTGLRGLARSDALLLHVAVEPSAGSAGGPCVLYIELRELPRDRIAVLPGRRVIFTGCRVPAESVLGDRGGAEVLLRTLQVSGSAVWSMSLAAADVCLGIAVDRALKVPRATNRSLSPREIAEILNGAFLDLLACDCLVLVGTRAAGLAPGETSVLSAVARSVVPTLLGDTVRELAALLGPQSLRRDGIDRAFARHARQLAVLGAGGTGAFIGRATVLVQLPLLARQVWPAGQHAPGALFDPAGVYAGFDSDRLDLVNTSDTVAGLLADPSQVDWLWPDGGEAERLTVLLRAELDHVRRHFASIPAGGPELARDPRSLALADRYLLLLMAAACLGCYGQLRRRGTGFLAESVWITEILRRIVRRLGHDGGVSADEDIRRIRSEMVNRFASGRGFDLHETVVDY